MSKVCRKSTAENFVETAWPTTNAGMRLKYEAWLKRKPKTEQVARALLDDDFKNWRITYMAKRINRYLKYSSTRAEARRRLERLKAERDADFEK